MRRVSERRPGVFLSHTWADKQFVQRLAADLGRAGARVWLDEAEIQVGDSLIEKIRRGIDDMDYLLVVLSPESTSSEWVKRELDVAMNQEIRGKRVKVLPLLYKQCELPGFLEGKLYADFTEEAKYEAGLSAIIRRLSLHDFKLKKDIKAPRRELKTPTPSQLNEIKDAINSITGIGDAYLDENIPRKVRDRVRIICKIPHDGQVLAVFTMSTLPPSEVPADSQAAYFQQLVRGCCRRARYERGPRGGDLDP